MTVRMFFYLDPFLIAKFPSLLLKNKCWNSIWKTSCTSRIIVFHLAKWNTFTHKEFVYSISQNFRNKNSEYPFIYTVFKQWFWLVCFGVASKPRHRVCSWLGDLPAARRQHERETAIVRRERWENREQDWQIKGKERERGKSEGRSKKQGEPDGFLSCSGFLPLADLLGCIQGVPQCGG